MNLTSDRILIRWAAGHVAVGSPGREQYVELRGITDADKAREFGEKAIALHQAQRQTVSVTGHVLSDAQAPIASYRPGDRLGGHTIRSITITMGPEGETVVTPELADPLAILEEQLDRRLERANAGVTSEHASPMPPPAERSSQIDSTPPKFAYDWQTPAPEEE